MANREDLIKELYSNIVGDAPTPKDDGHRYHADTNTLTTGKTIELTESNHRHEIGLEKEQYAEIMMGVRNYFLCKDTDFQVGDVIAFRETAGFQLTGNDSLRTIKYVERNRDGLKDGYCIVSWK